MLSWKWDQTTQDPNAPVGGRQEDMLCQELCNAIYSVQACNDITYQQTKATFAVSLAVPCRLLTTAADMLRI